MAFETQEGYIPIVTHRFTSSAAECDSVIPRFSAFIIVRFSRILASLRHRPKIDVLNYGSSNLTKSTLWSWYWPGSSFCRIALWLPLLTKIHIPGHCCYSSEERCSLKLLLCHPELKCSKVSPCRMSSLRRLFSTLLCFVQYRPNHSYTICSPLTASVVRK